MLDAPPQTSEETFPKSFGAYVLLARLGSGGMGDVYLAKHAGLAGVERPCVVKTLREHLAEDREYVNRFIDEARVTVQLSHKNVCSVFDVGRIGRRYYLAMDLVVGRTLREVWERGATIGLPPDEALALYLVGEVLEALDYAHRRADPMTGGALGIVHRDVSPQNVMVSVEGEVRLIDFGLAASSNKMEKTEPNVVLGKMAYMAPEHARGDVVDASADQFSAGILAYELVTGARFYEGFNTQQVWHTAGLGGFRPSRFSSLPGELAAILDRTFAAERGQRFSSCGDLREAIATYAFSRGLRSGPRELRAHLQGLFRSELDEVSDTLRRYAHIPPPSTPTEAPGFEVTHIASTMPGTISSELGSAPPAVTTSPPSFAPLPAARAVTSDEAGARRSTPLLVVAALACVALGGLGVIALRGTGDGATATGAAAQQGARERPRQPVASSPVGDRPSAQLVPGHAEAPGGEELPAERAPPAEAAPPAEVVTPATVVEPPAEKAPRPSDARRPRRGQRSRRAPPPKQRASPPTTYSEKLQVLERCNDPCAPRALVNARRLAELSADETLRTKRAVDACAARCVD